MDEHVRWANSEQAHNAAVALVALLHAAPKRTRTVQWMPELDACRFEVIDVKSGHIVSEVAVDVDGRVALRDSQLEGEADA